MKKILSVLLAALMLFSMTAAFTACNTNSGAESTPPAATTAPPASGSEATEPPASGSETEPETEETPAAEVPAATSPDTLTVGTTDMNGDFIYGFGNSAYDKMVKDLLGGAVYYDVYRGMPDGNIVLNTVVVKDVQTELDAEGNKTYAFTLHEDLKWSDGSAITAQDYVFAMLWAASPQWRIAGATSSDGDTLVGYAEYYNAELETAEQAGGETNYFKGISLLGDYSFSLTIAAENLPYFFETVLVAVGPRCMAVYAPGATIVSDENGSKITGVDLMACANNIASTERYKPTVVCGPYKFVSFENKIVTLVANEYFKGDIDGKKPSFQNVVIKNIPMDTDVDMVLSGDIDLTTGVIEGNKIERAKAADNAVAHSFLRNGYGYLAFHCDWGPTADVNVRWGIASLIDRNEVVNYVLGGYGGTVDADYGLAQWMYQEKRSELASKLKPISFNIEAANAYFDLTEWAFEADGVTPFDASKANADGTYLRHNASGQKFVIEHLGTENNQVTDIIEIIIKANAPLAGLEFNVTKSDFDALLTNYYYGYSLGDDRFYNTFNLAVTFDVVYDPYYSSYHSEYIGTWVNSPQIADAELDSIMMDMRSLDPSQKADFANKWVDFQVRWNQLLPLVPLYSNEYFDIYNTRITGLQTTPFVSWAETVCSITLAP